MISLRDVNYAYEGREALRGINLDISRGESVAFIGPNGSGKSTLLKLLNAIVLPDNGSYVFDGESVTRASLKDQTFGRSFHQRIGFLFQIPRLSFFVPPWKRGLIRATTDGVLRGGRCWSNRGLPQALGNHASCAEASSGILSGGKEEGGFCKHSRSEP